VICKLNFGGKTFGGLSIYFKHVLFGSALIAALWNCFYRDFKKQIFLALLQTRIVTAILAERGFPTAKANTY
jgi:hypothetical protein